MIQSRICQQCGHSFEGGPRAYYCPSCRVERQKITKATYRERKRKGESRSLGSKDKCERCGKEYTVESGLQRFCPDCQPIHTLEYDRETALPFYHQNKDRLNPVRNERRRVGERNCDWCGAVYVVTVGGQLTCSEECKRKLKNKNWNEKYGPRYRQKKKENIQDSRK